MLFALGAALERNFWVVGEDVRVDPDTDIFLSDEYHLLGDEKVTEYLGQRQEALEYFDEGLEGIVYGARVYFLKKVMRVPGGLQQQPPAVRVDDLDGRHLCSSDVVSSCIGLSESFGGTKERFPHAIGLELQRTQTTRWQVAVTFVVLVPFTFVGGMLGLHHLAM